MITVISGSSFIMDTKKGAGKFNDANNDVMIKKGCYHEIGKNMSTQRYIPAMGKNYPENFTTAVFKEDCHCIKLVIGCTCFNIPIAVENQGLNIV